MQFIADGNQLYMKWYKAQYQEHNSDEVCNGKSMKSVVRWTRDIKKCSPFYRNQEHLRCNGILIISKA